MLQQFIVALAAICAVWHWMPSDWRRSAAVKWAAGSQRIGWVDAQGADQLVASLGKACGCAACGKCGGGAAEFRAPAGGSPIAAGSCDEAPRAGVQ